MEKAAVAGVGAGVRWEYVLGCCAALLAWAPGLAAHAQDAIQRPAEVVAQARAEPPVRVQVQTSSLPRLDREDSGFQAPRVDLSVTRLNASGSGLGAVLGMASPPTGAQAPGVQPRPSVDLGVRWSQRLQSQRQVDITAWRRVTTPDDDAINLVQMHQPSVYGARVEMNLSAGPSTSFKLDHGFLGLQLESGARITVKRKDGRPMVYYRTTF